jgi:hypothetical protein
MRQLFLKIKSLLQSLQSDWITPKFLGETVDEIIIEKEMIAKENAVIFVSYDSRSHINKIKNDMIYNEVIYGEKGMNIFQLPKK